MYGGQRFISGYLPLLPSMLSCCCCCCFVLEMGSLHWTPSLPFHPCSLASKPQESFSIPQLLNYRHPQQCPAFMWMLETQLRSSCLYRRCSAHHAIVSSNRPFLFNWEKNQILYYKENISIHSPILNSDHLLQGRRVTVLNTHVSGVCGQSSLCGIKLGNKVPALLKNQTR